MKNYRSEFQIGIFKNREKICGAVTNNNTRNVILLASLCIVVLLTISCSKEKLGIKPNSTTVIPTTVTDFQALLDNTDFMNAGYLALGEISADNYYLSAANYLISSVQERNAYVWNKAIYEGESSSDWNAAYSTVFYANIVLEGIDKLSVTSGNKDQIDYIRGQALFVRAFAFFQLAQLYSIPFNKATISSSDLGIPLRTTADVNIKTDRSTLQESYNKITADIVLAGNLLSGKPTPPFPLNKTRAGTLAVDGLLSRVYLSMGDYDNALSSADRYLKANSTLIDYNTLQPTASFPFTRFNVEDTFHATLLNMGNLIQSRLLIEPTLIQQYETDDLRKMLYFRANADGTFSFKGNYDGTGNPLYGGLATDEILLTRAECHARKGNAAEALNDLNTLLVKRYRSNTYIPKTGLDAATALKEILKERRKELLLRGSRWTDLRRLNLETPFQTTLTRSVNGEMYSLPPNDPRYVLPIPDDVITYNPDMKQNIR